MIKVDSVSFSYADKKVLDNVSFCVSKGQLLAIIGQNAVGKTTLIKLMTGILVPSDGKVSIDGQEKPQNFSTTQRKWIGVMQEIKGVYLKMTGYEYLAFVGAMYGMSSEEIKTAIECFSREYNMEKEVHRTIKKYSSGTKKKIEFFAAILFEPKVLFLDEPFESVDPTIQYEIKKRLQQYIHSGGTLIITSHILDSVQNLCTDYLILANGKVVLQGSIDDTTNLEELFMEVVGHGQE